MNEYGALLEWYTDNKTEVLRGKPVPLPLCPPQIPVVEQYCSWTPRTVTYCYPILVTCHIIALCPINCCKVIGNCVLFSMFIGNLHSACYFARCVSRFSSSSWSMLFSVWISMPSALATLIISSPKDLRSSMKSISCPVNGLVSLGQEWLHCGHEQRSMRWWGQLTRARWTLAFIPVVMGTVSLYLFVVSFMAENYCILLQDVFPLLVYLKNVPTIVHCRESLLT